MIKESDVKVAVHKKFGPIYKPVEYIVGKMYDWTSSIYTDIPDSTIESMHSDMPKLYVGVHKSLWETMGVPLVIKRQNAQVPYIVIGKNLVKGPSKFFMKGIGCIYVERAAKSHEHQDFNSAIEIKKKITTGLDTGYSILIFPTDGRTKDGRTPSFYSTPFDSALAASRPVHIIPFNVSYEKIPDMGMIIQGIQRKKSYTFRVWHFPNWWKDLGDMYVTFSDPITVTADMNRKSLNRRALAAAQNCEKILPVNISADAILRSRKDNNRMPLRNYIDQTIEDYIHQEKKFIGFKSSQDVIDKSPLFPGASDLECKIYSNYIAHYLENGQKQQIPLKTSSLNQYV